MAARDAFRKEHAADVHIELDNADILVKRVTTAGEKPDLIVSPGTVEMDAMVAADHVAKEDVSHFGVYELVLFCPRSNPGKVTGFEDLTRPEVKVIALADPTNNSVGRYTRQALRKMGLWDRIEEKIVLTDHPITAYKAVAREKAEASFAYRSCPLKSAPEKLAYSKVRIVESVPRESYGPAFATIGILKSSQSRPPAQAFVKFLLSPAGQKLLADHGVPNLVRLDVFIPCGMLSPLFTIKHRFEAGHPNVSLNLVFDRVDALTRQILDGKARPDLHLSIGRTETEQLVAGGHVKREDVQPVGRFRLALCTHVSRKESLRKMEDLVGREIKRIVLTRPEHSSVGACARTVLEKVGLWERVQAKIDYMPTIKDCYRDLSAGKADAGFAYLGCPIPIDPEKAAYSKVVTVQQIDEALYDGSVASISVLATSTHRDASWTFAKYLAGESALETLADVGLTPLDEPGKEK
jgi:molybdate transport system substrate-binding protein